MNSLFYFCFSTDKHSLLYLYTMQSINSNDHLYDCTAVTLLNDTQIDFYSSSDKPRTAKQNWLKNISEPDWKTRTEKLQYDAILLNRLIDIQMSEFGHSNSGKNGCFRLLFSKISTPPAVYMFAKKSVRDSRKLTLTCLITGFYPKDVKMSLRGNSTSLPDHLITSSGVRPNHNGTYQLRKSVEIQEDDKADYYCHVSHSSLTEPVIKQWEPVIKKWGFEQPYQTITLTHSYAGGLPTPTTLYGAVSVQILQADWWNTCLLQAVCAY
uniref:Ig-like domain-containing protein n=1 Tax=Astyanax mexicanus TaxID=7994 RepID=W5LKI1_ASTMX